MGMTADARPVGGGYSYKPMALLTMRRPSEILDSEQIKRIARDALLVEARRAKRTMEPMRFPEGIRFHKAEAVVSDPMRFVKFVDLDETWKIAKDLWSRTGV